MDRAVKVHLKCHDGCCCKPGPAAGGAASLGPQPAPMLARGPAIAPPGGGELMHANLKLGISAHQLRT